MQQPDNFKEWLAKAEDDYLFANECIEHGTEHFAPVCFHYHQAIEKYLKAFIICRN
jgi:HEPN domain-containing protein